MISGKLYFLNQAYEDWSYNLSGKKTPLNKGRTWMLMSSSILNLGYILKE